MDLVYGDEDNIKTWADFHTEKGETGSVACYNNTSSWICFGRMNEFQFLMVQVNEANNSFGAVKLVTNNTLKEEIIYRCASEEEHDLEGVLSSELIITALYEKYSHHFFEED